MARLIENKTKENRSLAENSLETENLNLQIRSLNEKIRKLTGEN